jgi:hypothetical protein
VTHVITRERLPHHPLLGRNLNHDSRSWTFAVQPQETPIKPVRHESFISILNQGNIGACTGNAALACAYRAPFYAPGAPEWAYAPIELGALDWYRRNTQLDPFDGTYEPDDTGSDGLTASKVALEAGIISGYQMSGDLQSSLEALQDRPGITGIPWYSSMFDPDSGGLMTVNTKSGVAGGHELCVDEIVGPTDPGNGTGKILVGGPNSWGETWGDHGRWYLTADDWWALRQQGGDVYFWTAKSQPPPAPIPEPVATFTADDLEMYTDTVSFRHDRHVTPNIVKAVRAIETWAARKGIR